MLIAILGSLIIYMGRTSENLENLAAKIKEEEDKLSSSISPETINKCEEGIFNNENIITTRAQNYSFYQPFINDITVSFLLNQQIYLVEGNTGMY